MNFIPKDFKVNKPSGSFDTSTKATGENDQPIPIATTKQTTLPGSSVTIPLSSPRNLPITKFLFRVVGQNFKISKYQL